MTIKEGLHKAIKWVDEYRKVLIGLAIVVFFLSALLIVPGSHFRVNAIGEDSGNTALSSLLLTSGAVGMPTAYFLLTATYGAMSYVDKSALGYVATALLLLLGVGFVCALFVL